MMSNKVSILMGSKSNLDIMKKAAEMLAQFGIEYDIKVLSAHRTPHGKPSPMLKIQTAMYLLLVQVELHTFQGLLQELHQNQSLGYP